MTFSEALMNRQKKQFSVLVYNQSWQDLSNAEVIAYGSQNCGYSGPNSFPLVCGYQFFDSCV